MKKPALVIMAAGMGSRYGGMKQIDPFGPNGEIIMDYSIYDALRAGFGRVVFIIKKENEQIFKEKIGTKIEKYVDTEIVYQQIEDVPAGFEVPAGRIKPWGTGHAVLSCRNVVDSNFAVINADDYYGAASFKVLYDELSASEDQKDSYRYCMVGFQLENTLTDYGHVSRGVCSVDQDGYLVGIQERTKIRKFNDGVKYTEDEENWLPIPAGSTVSMNMWGFTPGFLRELETRFPQFLENSFDNILRAEYYLPKVVDSLLKEGKARVKVLASPERWYGVTYQEDKPYVREAFSRLIQQGVYPPRLWE